MSAACRWRACCASCRQRGTGWEKAWASCGRLRRRATSACATTCGAGGVGAMQAGRAPSCNVRCWQFSWPTCICSWCSLAGWHAALHLLRQQRTCRACQAERSTQASLFNACRQLFRSYAMTVPLDNLARGLLAHALPHLWQKRLASQEGAHRQQFSGINRHAVMLDPLCLSLPCRHADGRLAQP